MISVYCHRLDRGGAETAIVEIANLLGSSGRDVEFVTAANDAPLYESLLPGVSKYHLNASRTIAGGVPLARYLRRRQPEVLISTLLRCNFVACMASGIGGWKGRLVLRETTLVYERNSGARLLLMKALYFFMSFRVDEVVVPSSTMLPGLSKLSKRYARKAKVVPNVVRRSARTEINTAHDGQNFRLIVVGRLEPVKGIELVLSALSHSTMCRILEVYGDGSERMSLMALSEELGVSDRVRFHGHVDGLEEMHRGGGVLVSASHFEGFPNAIVESLIAGLGVVIVGKSDEYSDLVSTFGLSRDCFVPTRDALRLAGTLDEALKNTAMFRAAPDRVAEYLATINRRVEDGYLGTLEGRSGTYE